MEVRILRYEDATAVERLIESRPSMLGISDPDSLRQVRERGQLNLLNLLEHSDRGHQLGRVFGAYEDQRLVGVLITLTSAEQPCWYMTRAHTLFGVQNGPRILGALTNEAVTLYEAGGFRRFYTMYPKRYVRAYQLLWQAPIALRNYLSYTDLEVPPLTRPKFTDFWEMLFGRSLYTSHLVVRGFIKVTDTEVIQRHV